MLGAGGEGGGGGGTVGDVRIEQSTPVLGFVNAFNFTSLEDERTSSTTAVDWLHAI